MGRRDDLNRARFGASNELASEISKHDSQTLLNIKIADTFFDEKFTNYNVLKSYMFKNCDTMSFKDSFKPLDLQPSLTIDSTLKCNNGSLNDCRMTIDLNNKNAIIPVKSFIANSPYEKFRVTITHTLVNVAGNPVYETVKETQLVPSDFGEENDLKTFGKRTVFKGLKPKCFIWDIDHTYEFSARDFKEDDFIKLGDFGSELKGNILSFVKEKTLIYNSLALFSCKMTNYSLDSNNIEEHLIVETKPLRGVLLEANNLYDAVNSVYTSSLNYQG